MDNLKALEQSLNTFPNALLESINSLMQPFQNFNFSYMNSMLNDIIQANQSLPLSVEQAINSIQLPMTNMASMFANIDVINSNHLIESITSMNAYMASICPQYLFPKVESFKPINDTIQLNITREEIEDVVGEEPINELLGKKDNSNKEQLKISFQDVVAIIGLLITLAAFIFDVHTSLESEKEKENLYNRQTELIELYDKLISEISSD